MKPKKFRSKIKSATNSTFLFIGLNSFITERRGNLCFHLPKLNFTNALFKEDCQTFQIVFSKLVAKKWEDLDNSHCHPLDQGGREKLGKFLQLSTNEINKILTGNNDVYQIALDEEDKFRVIGIKDRFDNRDYFEILLFDPNHLFYLNERKSWYPFGDETVCLMDCLGRNKGEKCSLADEPPKNKNLIRKK